MQLIFFVFCDSPCQTTLYTTLSDRLATLHVVPISDLMLSSLFYFISMISGDHDCPEFINSQRGSSGSVGHSYSSRSTLCDTNSLLLGQEEKSWTRPYASRRRKNVVCLSHRVSGKNVIGFGTSVLFLVTTKHHGALCPPVGQLQDTHR